MNRLLIFGLGYTANRIADALRAALLRGACAAVLLADLLRTRRWLALAGAAAALAILVYLPAGEPREGTVPLTLVQPNLGQDEINDAARFEEQFQRIAALSVPREARPNRLVLWPESGVPDYLRDGYPQRYYTQMTAGGDPAFARARIGRVIGADSLLLTGVVDLEIEMVEGREKAVAAYNAITSIDPDGRLGERYAKAHLVPYGEYLPLRSWLEPLGLSRLVAGTLDFIPGPGPLSYDLGAYGKAGMQICYEIVFSGEVADRSNRPDYIFNPSNDGWFGRWGPPQHLAQARMRAAEEGLPVLRSTTTGISAVIDARGVVREHIGRNVADRIDTLNRVREAGIKVCSGGILGMGETEMDRIDMLLALGGKISSDLAQIIRKRPMLFAELIRDLKDMPDHAVLRIVREVRDGNWEVFAQGEYHDRIEE